MCVTTIGTRRPGIPRYTQALPGLFRIMCTHITRTGREDTLHALYSLCVLMHADVRIAYSVVTKYASAIAHQMQHSQVLPGYPHSSAGAYGHNLIYCLTINDKNISIIFINRALQLQR